MSVVLCALYSHFLVRQPNKGNKYVDVDIMSNKEWHIYKDIRDQFLGRL